MDRRLSQRCVELDQSLVTALGWPVLLCRHAAIVGAAPGVHPAKARRIAANIAKLSYKQSRRQVSAAVGGLASSPQTMCGVPTGTIVGASDWRRKRVKSVQFDHESIPPRTCAFSTSL